MKNHGEFQQLIYQLAFSEILHLPIENNKDFSILVQEDKGYGRTRQCLLFRLTFITHAYIIEIREILSKQSVVYSF